MLYVRFKYITRSLAIATYPATVPLVDRPSNWATKGASFKLTDKWLDFIASINSERAMNYLLKAHSGWVNALSDDGTPISESLTMGGNVAEVISESGDYLLIASLTPTGPLPDPNNPLYVHTFTCINKWSQPAPPADGTIIVKYPFLTKNYGWVHKSKVDIFDTIPNPILPTQMPPIGYKAVLLKGAVVRTRPFGNKVYVSNGEIVYVSQELLGWCKIGEKRWVLRSDILR